LTAQNRNHTANRNHPAAGWTAETPQTTRYAAVGSYTDIDTLTRGTTRHAVRPGSYTDVDTLTHPRADVTVRPGSYIDIDAPSGRLPDFGRPGSYTDTDRGGR
jgi:hypothetical protein